MSGQQNITSPLIFGGCYVKRLTAQLGFNSSPTTVEVELIEGLPSVAEDITNKATGFMYDALNPGQVSGLQLGAFNFAGIVQSWTRNYNEQGRTFTVKLADPRIIFDNIPVIMGYDVLSTGVSYPNVLHSFGYYGNPRDAGVTSNGVIFKNVRNFLATGTTRINLFNKQFNLVFGSGFNDGTGTLNPNGIPPWYKIQSNMSSLGSLLGQVGRDMGFDYYVSIYPSGNYASTGVISQININTIKRTNTASSTEIDDFLTAAVSSGTRKSESRGKELVTDSTSALVAGAPLTLWTSYNSAGGEVLPYWGRAADGSLVYSQGSYQSSGIVLLENITGSGINTILGNSAFRVTYDKVTINRNFSDSVYPPPSMSITTSTDTATGCYASENLLRAALFSQLAWEALFYKEQQSRAILLGIDSDVFMDASMFATTEQNILNALSLSLTNTNARANRDPFVSARIGAVYDAFRNTAQNYYGKQWVLISNNHLSFYTNNSKWATDGFSYTEEFPSLEYSPVSSAWCESGQYPSGIDNHEILLATRTEVFKDEQGRLKPFLSYSGYNTAQSNFPYPIDISVLPRNGYLIEQGNKLCLPISVDVYERQPYKFIVTVNSELQGFTASGDYPQYANQQAYMSFLYAMGYNDSTIAQYNLHKNIYDESEFGLAPAKPLLPKSVAQNYGFFIPVQFKTFNFGPWYASGARPGGINIQSNGDLQPATYGSYSYLNTVGSQTVAKAVSVVDVVDNAEITLAGLPVYNIGDTIGINSNITNISLQYGTDGLTTNYTIRTFALPAVRISKSLQDKITLAQNIANKNNSELVNFNNRVVFNSRKIQKESDFDIFGSKSKNKEEGYTTPLWMQARRWLVGVLASGVNPDSV